MKITLKITKPTEIVLDVPPDTLITLDGKETPGQTPGVEPIVDQAKIYTLAKKFADAREDYVGLRVIRDGFAGSSDRLTLVSLFAGKGVDANEFLGVLVENGQTSTVAQAIYAGINSSLGARGQA